MVDKKPKRKKTELGRTLAKIRIDFDETGAEMAKKLGISASQMFNIEVGIATVGYEFVGHFKKVYEIDLTELMERGGFMSIIKLDLDTLCQQDKDTILEIWARAQTGEEPPPAKHILDSTNSRIEPAPVKPTADAPVRKRPRSPVLDDGIGFLDEDSANDLSDIKAEDVL